MAEMAIGGTNDSASPYIWGTYPTCEYTYSSKKVRVTLDGAEHVVFTGPCEKITCGDKQRLGENRKKSVML